MRVFVTVGTTKFDSLVRKILSEDVLVALKAKGYNQVTIQSGKSDFDKKGSCLVFVWNWRDVLLQLVYVGLGSYLMA